MKKPIARLWLWVVMMASFSSCGMLDFEFAEDGAETARDMLLNYDTVYVMRGDTFSIVPVFKPDTVNNSVVQIRSTDPAVVAVYPDRIEAVGVGRAKLYIESVSARILDSCMVYVIEPWMQPQQVWPYETVFYANATVKGKALTEGMTVAAFVGEECRAFGERLNFHGISLMQFRIGSLELYAGEDDTDWDIDDSPDPDKSDEDDDEDDEDESQGGTIPVYHERITFRCYDRRQHQLYIAPQRENIDGVTHGILSELYEIRF